jgi:alanine racemase/UDP-N-acetylmuramoyl-tripeptide--D-alanyl-D-alanine ligase
MTHFPSAEDPSTDAFTLQQIACFDRVIQEIQNAGIAVPWKHAANSSASIRFSLPQYNMVRIGLAIYGLYSSEAVKQAQELLLAVSLISHIVGINTCKKGETVSYGRTYTVKKEIERIATLPIGYFDGLHRNYSGKNVVMIRGKKAPMIGKICMDFMMVDVTHIPSASIGDTALIFGEDEQGQYLAPEDLAASGDSIVHELITCLGPRIPRIFIHEEAYTPST